MPNLCKKSAIKSQPANQPTVVYDILRVLSVAMFCLVLCRMLLMVNCIILCYAAAHSVFVTTFIVCKLGKHMRTYFVVCITQLCCK